MFQQLILMSNMFRNRMGRAFGYLLITLYSFLFHIRLSFFLLSFILYEVTEAGTPRALWINQRKGHRSLLIKRLFICFSCSAIHILAHSIADIIRKNGLTKSLALVYCSAILISSHLSLLPFKSWYDAFGWFWAIMDKNVLH